MARPYRLSADSKRDLDSHWHFIAKDNPSAADHLIERLYAVFRLLKSQPEMGELRDDIRPGIRVFSVGNYGVFYRLTGARVFILRVLHGAQDLGGKF